MDLIIFFLHKSPQNKIVTSYFNSELADVKPAFKALFLNEFLRFQGNIWRGCIMKSAWREIQIEEAFNLKDRGIKVPGFLITD